MTGRHDVDKGRIREENQGDSKESREGRKKRGGEQKK